MYTESFAHRADLDIEDHYTISISFLDLKIFSLNM